MRTILQYIRERGSRVADVVSEFIGYAACPMPLQRATRAGEVSLDLTGYRQFDSFSCGAIAAAMAVKYLRPRMSFERIYAAVSPSRRSGAGSGRVACALRSLGVRVETRTDLAFDAICAAIDDGSPVLVCFTTRDPDTDHWVVLYGYGRRPDSLFVAGRGIPFISRNRIARRRFEHLWSPAGAGLVCAKRPSI